MEDFKIELFEEQYSIEFPYYKSLSGEFCCKTSKSIEIAFELNQLDSITHKVSESDSYFQIDDEFNLKQTLAHFEVVTSDHIYLSWSYLEQIDLMSIDDVNNYFFDLWFPSSDDLIIFDSSIDWILYIRHDGLVSLLHSTE